MDDGGYLHGKLFHKASSFAPNLKHSSISDGVSG
jgi:hypothetical protein